MSTQEAEEIVEISSWKFVAGCALAAVVLILLGQFYQLPASLLALEVFLTIISLFVLGSFRYRIDKNAITYGMVLVIFATFWGNWWQGSAVQGRVKLEGISGVVPYLKHYLLTLHGLDELVHADTMLFILGLTLFVAVIAQTRLLESISFSVLRKYSGKVVPTIATLTAVVSVASGILDGVSMIGLMIRILVMILFLAKVKDEAVLYSVMVSTVVTTVCGMWMAYGEPPNLIMKANLHPHLDNAFFLRYCAPVAIGSYFLVYFNIRKRLKGRKIDIQNLDILDLHIADVRFLQAMRHGQVLTPVEFVDQYRDRLGEAHALIERRLHKGEPLGETLIHEKVAPALRKEILGRFVTENLSDDLDRYYKHVVEGDVDNRDESLKNVSQAIRATQKQRRRSQWVGALAFVPFVGLLIVHAINHEVPLLYASFAGFAVAFLGIIKLANIRRLALHEAKHEYMEYLFLLPLFFSITLLQKTGFFSQISGLLHEGIEKLGVAHIAYIQYTAATFLSAILDNNVVADFASRGLHGLEVTTLHLFAMAQIAGYAAGGCWTHIGSAQSVVSYAFIRRELDPKYTPLSWIKSMTPLILEIFLLMTVVVYGEAALLHFLH